MAIAQLQPLPDAGHRLQRILVATDFSLAARNAASRAGQIARLHDAEVHLLHVGARSRAHGDCSSSAACNWTDIAQFAEASIRHEARRVSAESFANVNGTLCFGDPAETILRVAAERDVQMLVFGARGMHGPHLPTTSLGRTAIGILSRADLPMLLVRDARAAAYQECLVAVGSGASPSNAASEWASALTHAAAVRPIDLPRDLQHGGFAPMSQRDKVQVLFAPRNVVRSGALATALKNPSGAHLCWCAPLDVLLID